jgi:hypothetical protein
VCCAPFATKPRQCNDVKFEYYKTKPSNEDPTSLRKGETDIQYSSQVLNASLNDAVSYEFV